MAKSAGENQLFYALVAAIVTVADSGSGCYCHQRTQEGSCLVKKSCVKKSIQKDLCLKHWYISSSYISSFSDGTVRV